jgi:cobalt-zinc-cadmium efflux system protein
MAGAVGLQLAHPLIVRSFIDAATTGTDPAVLARTALLFLGVAVLAQALAVAKTYVAEDVGWTATNGLRADLTAHCLGLDMGFHNAHLPGELVERVDEDTAALADFFARFVLEIVTSALLLAGTLAVLAAIDWRTGVGFALFAAAGNAVSVTLLVAGQSESLNIRGAFLEVLSDMLAALATAVAALIIWATGFQRADAIASMLIGVMILPRAWALLRDGINILLEATPKGVDLDEVHRRMLAVPGVQEVHDLHAWMITSGVPVLAAHVVVDRQGLPSECTEASVLDRLGALLRDDFDVEHCTFQLEPRGHAEHEARLCH